MNDEQNTGPSGPRVTFEEEGRIIISPEVSARLDQIRDELVQLGGSGDHDVYRLVMSLVMPMAPHLTPEADKGDLEAEAYVLQCIGMDMALSWATTMLAHGLRSTGMPEALATMLATSAARDRFGPNSLPEDRRPAAGPFSTEGIASRMARRAKQGEGNLSSDSAMEAAIDAMLEDIIRDNAPPTVDKN